MGIFVRFTAQFQEGDQFLYGARCELAPEIGDEVILRVDYIPALSDALKEASGQRFIVTRRLHVVKIAGHGTNHDFHIFMKPAAE